MGKYDYEKHMILRRVMGLGGLREMYPHQIAGSD